MTRKRRKDNDNDDGCGGNECDNGKMNMMVIVTEPQLQKDEEYNGDNNKNNNVTTAKKDDQDNGWLAWEGRDNNGHIWPTYDKNDDKLTTMITENECI